MFYKKGVLKNFSECTWKQLRSVTLIKKTPVQVFSCEICEIFKNLFWQNTSGRLLLDFFSFTQLFFATQWTNRNQAFSIFEHVLSRLSNVMNITNFTSRNRRPSCSCWETQFSEKPQIKRCFLGWLTYEHSYLYAYWIFVLHFPVILYLKFKEATTNVIHWFRGVL